MPRAATVILPDLAVRLAVLRLQDLPWSSEEREALVRWRLGQEQLLSLTGAKVFSQVLSEPGGSGDGPCTVLAVVVQEAVLAQYEAVCEAAGLIPQEVDVSSLRLFNLWTAAQCGSPRHEAPISGLQPPCSRPPLRSPAEQHSSAVPQWVLLHTVGCVPSPTPSQELLAPFPTAGAGRDP